MIDPKKQKWKHLRMPREAIDIFWFKENIKTKWWGLQELSTARYQPINAILSLVLPKKQITKRKWNLRTKFPEFLKEPCSITLGSHRSFLNSYFHLINRRAKILFFKGGPSHHVPYKDLFCFWQLQGIAAF